MTVREETYTDAEGLIDTQYRDETPEELRGVRLKLVFAPLTSGETLTLAQLINIVRVLAHDRGLISNDQIDTLIPS